MRLPVAPVMRGIRAPDSDRRAGPGSVIACAVAFPSPSADNDEPATSHCTSATHTRADNSLVHRVAKHNSGESWADAWIVAVAIAPLAAVHEQKR